MNRARRWAALLACVSASAAAASAPDHEAYVWQRQWTPALRGALADSRGLFGGVRVLVAQAGRHGGWLETQADPSAFAGDARERIAVIRYDGVGAPPEIAALKPYLDRLLARWREHGAPFSAVEIDYDCATARLADYASRLRELRKVLPSDVRLSLTALPAWLAARELDDVLAAADEAVLQVHAVQNPRRGLFDAALAERWSRAFAARTHKPFRLALPAYGSRVHFDAQGRAVAVESEAPVDAWEEEEDARELAADPHEVVGLLAHLRDAMPAHWRGVVWFRLPVAGDRRAWTLAALREVVGGAVPQAVFDIRLQAQPNGAIDLAVANRGGIAAPAPALRIATACQAWDAPGDWTARLDGAVLRFEPKPGRSIAPGRERAVGWVRCARMPDVGVDASDEGGSR